MSDKLKIAQAKECVNRLDRYTKGIKSIISMVEVVSPIGQYNKLPDEFKRAHKGSMRVILQDLVAMKKEAESVIEIKKNKVSQLERNNDE